MKRSRDDEEEEVDVEKRVYLEFERTLGEDCGSEEAEIVRCTHSLRKLLVSGMQLRRESGKLSRKRMDAWRQGRLAYATKLGGLMPECRALGQVVGWRSTLKLCVEDAELSGKCVARVVAGLCESAVTPEALVAMDEETRKYDDLRIWTLKACKRWAASAESPLASCCSLLMKLVPPPLEEKDEKFLVDSSGEEDCSIAKQRRVLGEAWIEVLSKKGSMERLRTENVLDRVLIHLPEKVMPIMSKPLRLCDFFIAVFETEGVLALHGLFDLVVEHRLDYPDFFAKLVALVSPDLLYHKHRTKFLDLAKLALRNAPNKVRKSFAVRLAEASCQAPPRGIAAALVVLADLKQRCPETHRALTAQGERGHACLRALHTKHYAPVVRNAVANLLLHSTPPDSLEPFTYAALLAAEPKIPRSKKGYQHEADDSTAAPVPLVLLSTNADEETEDEGTPQSLARSFTAAALASGAVFIDQEPTEPVVLSDAAE